MGLLERHGWYQPQWLSMLPTWLITQFIALTVSSMGVSGSGLWQNSTSLQTARQHTKPLTGRT